MVTLALWMSYAVTLGLLCASIAAPMAHKARSYGKLAR